MKTGLILKKISVSAHNLTYEIKYSDYLTEEENKKMFVGIYDFVRYKNNGVKISSKPKLYNFNGIQAYVSQI